MIKARCIRACTFNGRYWSVGDVYSGSATPPLHFEIDISNITKEFKDSKDSKGSKAKDEKLPDDAKEDSP
jgi:hypothetical protein